MFAHIEHNHSQQFSGIPQAKLLKLSIIGTSTLFHTNTTAEDVVDHPLAMFLSQRKSAFPFLIPLKRASPFHQRHSSGWVGRLWRCYRVSTPCFMGLLDSSFPDLLPDLLHTSFPLASWAFWTAPSRPFAHLPGPSAHLLPARWINIQTTALLLC